MVGFLEELDALSGQVRKLERTFIDTKNELEGFLITKEKEIKTLTRQRKLLAELAKERGKSLKVVKESNKDFEKMETLLETQVKIQEELLKKMDGTTGSLSNFSSATKDATKETSALDDALKGIDARSSGFEKRNLILTKAIKKFTYEQQRGFSIGVQSFRDYQEFGGNALEYLAEFLVGTREEIQIFGLEAAKIRRVMYGFLPPGTFRIINKMASSLQFIGGIYRNLSDTGDEANNIFTKLLKTFTKFTTLKGLKSLLDFRSMIPDKFPALKKLDKQINNLKESMKRMEKGSPEYKEAKTKLLRMSEKRRVMKESPAQAIFNDMNKAMDSAMKRLGSRPELKGLKDELKSEKVRYSRLKERLALAEKAGDTRNAAFIKSEMKESKKKGLGLESQIADKSKGLGIGEYGAAKKIQKLMESQMDVLSKRSKHATHRAKVALSDPRKSADEKERAQIEAKKAQRAVSRQKIYLDAQKEMIEKMEENRGSFKGFLKAFGKFMSFSITNKARKLRDGLSNLILGAGSLIKTVLMGFVQFFIGFALLLIAIFALKKLFEKIRISEGWKAVKEFFQVIKPVFIGLWERVKDGFGLIKQAFSPGGTFKDLLLGIWKIASGVIGIYLTVLGTLIMSGLLLLGDFLLQLVTSIGEIIAPKIAKITDFMSKALTFLAIIAGIVGLVVYLASGAWVPTAAIAIGAAVASAVGAVFTNRKAVEKIKEGYSKTKDKLLGRHANGGTVTTPYQLVGEEGPELVSLPRGSKVSTASQTAKALSGVSMNNTFNITVQGNINDEQMMRQLADRIGNIIGRDLTRKISNSTILR